MKYKITLVVEDEKVLSADCTKYTERQPGQHRFADCGGSPRCVTCGCDEDDAFVGGEDCTYGMGKAS